MQQQPAVADLVAVTKARLILSGIANGGGSSHPEMVDLYVTVFLFV